MMKPVVLAVLLVGMVCGPAVADSDVTYVIDVVTASERHVILVADNSCGEVEIKTPERDSYVRVCARANAPHGVRLDLERRVREGRDEARTSAVVMAEPGVAYELLDATMTVVAR